MSFDHIPLGSWPLFVQALCWSTGLLDCWVEQCRHATATGVFCSVSSRVRLQARITPKVRREIKHRLYLIVRRQRQDAQNGWYGADTRHTTRPAGPGVQQRYERMT